MREGDASRGPSKNKSQDWLIGVDFLNLTYERLLLGMRARGPASRRPPSAITLAELYRSQGDASRRPPRCYQAISFTCADPLTDLHLNRAAGAMITAEVDGGQGDEGPQ
jgi:hypothetical protein